MNAHGQGVTAMMGEKRVRDVEFLENGIKVRGTLTLFEDDCLKLDFISSMGVFSITYEKPVVDVIRDMLKDR